MNIYHNYIKIQHYFLAELIRIQITYFELFGSISISNKLFHSDFFSFICD